jgi:uncharacterized protein
MMAPDFPPLIRAVLNGYMLDPWGTHGLTHWARVLENGLRLAEAMGADPLIVRLFAIFHDSRRENEYRDPEHGRRGALLAASLRPAMPCLGGMSDPNFARLLTACSHHTDTDYNDDPIIGTCWDADRLDLPRIGKTIQPRLLNTTAAREPEIIAWATRRSESRHVPDWIKTDWGCD